MNQCVSSSETSHCAHIYFEAFPVYSVRYMPTDTLFEYLLTQVFCTYL